MNLVPYLVWSIISALFCGLVAIALNRWASDWSRMKRISVSVIAAIFPALCVAGIALTVFDVSPFSMSPDEFLIPFGFQILMILVTSTPVAWLVVRRGAKGSIPTDVFE